MAEKTLDQMTDAEIDALSEEELEAHKLAASTTNGDGTIAAEDDPEDDDAADPGAAAEDDPDNDAETDDDDLTPEELAEIAGDDGKDKRIPYRRFKEVVDQNNELMAIVRAAVGNRQAPVEDAVDNTPQAPEYDFRKSRAEYHALVMKGKEEEAAAKLEEIDNAREALNDFKLQQAAQQAEARAVQQINGSLLRTEIGRVERRIVKQYPFLDPKDKNADPTAIAAVNSYTKELIGKGMPPAEALKQAGEKLGVRFEKLLISEGKLTAKTKAPDGTDPRARSAMQRNLNAQQSHTAGKKGVVNRTEARTLDVTKMTDAQLDKLTPEELEAVKLGKTEV